MLCEMQSHIKGFPERLEEMGDKLGTTIRCWVIILKAMGRLNE